MLSWVDLIYKICSPLPPQPYRYHPIRTWHALRGHAAADAAATGVETAVSCGLSAGGRGPELQALACVQCSTSDLKGRSSLWRQATSRCSWLHAWDASVVIPASAPRTRASNLKATSDLRSHFDRQKASHNTALVPHVMHSQPCRKRPATHPHGPRVGDHGVNQDVLLYRQGRSGGCR